MTQGEVLRQHMDRASRKPSDLFRSLGVTRQTIYNWLRGDNRITPDTLPSLKRELGLSDEEVGILIQAPLQPLHGEAS